MKPCGIISCGQHYLLILSSVLSSAIAVTSEFGVQPARNKARTVSQSSPADVLTDVVRYVKPLIGTAAHGHTYPGATAPFGMIQLSPDNGVEGWDWCGGYNYADSIIAGFSHTHFSGTGIGDLLDISVMPAAASVNLASVRWVGGKDAAKNGERQDGARRLADWSARFSHADEVATAGYYRTRFPEQGITAELTATELVGVHRYTFDPQTLDRTQGANAGIVVDLSFAVNWDNTTDAALRMRSRALVTGYRFSKGWAREQRVFFAMEFSRPIVQWRGMQDTSGVRDNLQLSSDSLLSYALRGTLVRACFEFTNEAVTPIVVKVALSSASEEGAVTALQAVRGKSFDQIQSETTNEWRRELSKIRIATRSREDAEMFYTALYHSFLSPVRFSDGKGEYAMSRFNFKFDAPSVQHFPVQHLPAQRSPVQRSANAVRYDVFSLWDTFRAVHPLFTLVQGERVPAMMRSLLDHQTAFGVLPVWTFWGTETKTMTGYNAVPVLADAIFKGFVRGADAERAYNAMKSSAMEDTLCVNLYRKYGYVPHDKDGFSVTKTLEFAFDDWCIAQTAQKLGKTADAKLFRERSTHWKNLVDTASRFIRGRLSDGAWKLPFDPYYSEHGFDAEYTEGNAWHYAWFVPHDVEGLIALYGGKHGFVRKLDSLFSVSNEVRGANVSSDISGLIGQYAHGNEPSHHIAYLYNVAGEPHKTQERTRQIIRALYNARPDGLCGNDDCGQMSAWLVFSMMGLYPMNPASGEYAITSPIVESASIQVGDGKTFTIRARGLAAGSTYIQSARLNGKPLMKPFVRHEDVVRGGELLLEMGATPSALWRKN